MMDTNDLSMAETEDVGTADFVTADVLTQPEGFGRLRRPTDEEIAAAVERVETTTLPRSEDA